MAIHSAHIGINFAGTNNALRGCVNDAEDLLKLWHPITTANGGSSDKLTERGATISNVRQFIGEKLALLKPGDLLFLSRSSHGTQVPDRDGDEHDGKDEAFVCYGLNLLIDDEFATLLTKRAAGSFVVVFDDCCHSGGGQRFMSDPDLPPDSKARNLPWDVIPDDCRAAVPRGVSPPPGASAGVLHIAACQADQVAWDGSRNGRANGAGTLAFLDSFERTGTWGQLFSRIRSQPLFKQYKQNPHIDGDEKLAAMPIVPIGSSPPVSGGIASGGPPETVKLYWPGLEQGIIYRRNG